MLDGDWVSNKERAPYEFDRSSVSFDDDRRLHYWTEKLGVSADVLREAVREVGNSPDHVFQYIQQRSKR